MPKGQLSTLAREFLDAAVQTPPFMWFVKQFTQTHLMHGGGFKLKPLCKRTSL